MARGNARQKIVRDDADRRRLIAGLETTVVRHGWELIAYVIMGNHLHLLVTNPPAPEARQLAGLDPKRIFAAVADFYGLDSASLSRRHDPHIARPVAAWLCRRHSEVSLRQLTEWLGLSRTDSVPNLTRRLEERLISNRRSVRSSSGRSPTDRETDYFGFGYDQGCVDELGPNPLPLTPRSPSSTRNVPSVFSGSFRQMKTGFSSCLAIRSTQSSPSSSAPRRQRKGRDE